jgi:RNA polymerase sigma-54 factor
MNMKPSLQLQQKGELAMTAELQQAITLLTYTAAEMHEFIAQEMADNPCLEYEDGAEAKSEREGQENEWDASAPDKGETWDADWETWAVRDEGQSGPAAETHSGGGSFDEAHDWLANQSHATTLQESLMQQFEEITDDAKLRLAARFLIDGLDEAGYLRLDLEAVASQLRLPFEVLDDARAIIQTLEPSGIGARDLAECLRLQLHARGQLETVCEVCLNHLDLVAGREYAKLVKLAIAAGAPETELEDVQLAITELQSCNPKPATGAELGFARIDAVVPDVIVSRTQSKEGAGWEVALNGAAFPRLMSVLPSGLSTTSATQAQKYVNERLGRAKWLIGALEQRARSTLLVAKAIVAAQPTFFDAGAEFLVPLTLRTVAEQVGLHESTISRVVSGKHMQTPFGVLPLRQFFASGVASSGGSVGVASSSVQNMIAKLVKAEDPRRPLSDEKIVDLLKGEGVVLARRTVAKYRGVLNIPGTAERRVRA